MLKIILIIAALVMIIGAAAFGSQIKNQAIKELGKSTDDLQCTGSFCTSCIIEGEKCNCGKEVCNCGKKQVDKKECYF